MNLKLFTDLYNLALNYQERPFWATMNLAKVGHLVPIDIDENKYFLQSKCEGEYIVSPKESNYINVEAIPCLIPLLK